jgi:hypothetical protein
MLFKRAVQRYRRTPEPDPFGRVGERTVSVQVTSVVRTSDRSFKVKWIETTYERGSQAGLAHWTAILTIVLKPPSSADTLRKNPLGLYGDAVDWSREIEPSAAAPVPATPLRTTPGTLPFGSPLDPKLARPAPTQLETQQ